MRKKNYIWDSNKDMEQGIDIENRTIRLERQRAISIIRNTLKEYPEPSDLFPLIIKRIEEDGTEVKT